MIVSASQKSNIAAPFEVELTCVEWSGLAVEEFVLLLGQEDLDSSFCGLVQTLSERTVGDVGVEFHVHVPGYGGIR